MTRNSLIPALLLAASFVSGCAASVPLASKVADTEAKEFRQDPGKSSLYLFRDEILGAAIPMRVAVNGQMLGTTAANTFFFLELEPGEYDVVGYAENESELSLDTKPGETRYVWQEVKMGAWQARNLIHEVDEERGRRGVEASKLIKLEADPSAISPKRVGGISTSDRLTKLKKLRKDGLISEEEYNAKRSEILNEI